MGSFPARFIKKPAHAISVLVKSATEDCDLGNISAKEKIHHFLPATFPLHCTLKNFHITKLNQSWKKLRTGFESSSSSDQCRSGIVFFYDEFYNRLFARSIVFQEKFPGLKMRSGILNRIIRFICSIDVLKLKETEKQLVLLGDNHITLNVYPWMYSVFAETLVETVMFCLGKDASFEDYQSWTSTLCFCLKFMLRQALKQKLDRREIYNNIFLAQDNLTYSPGEPTFGRFTPAIQKRNPASLRSSLSC